MLLARAASFAAVLGAAALTLYGQATSGVQISGVVTDSNGGVIAGARVKATQTDTGLVRSDRACLGMEGGERE